MYAMRKIKQERDQLNGLIGTSNADSVGTSGNLFYFSFPSAVACRFLIVILASCTLSMIYSDSFGHMKYYVSLSLSSTSIGTNTSGTGTGRASTATISVTSSTNNSDVEANEDSDRIDRILALQSCHWIANITNQMDQPCYDVLTSHMKLSLNQTRLQYLLSASPQLPYHYVNRRYVIFGDSTVYRLYAYTHLRALLMDKSVKLYQTQKRTGSTCDSPLPLQCRRIAADRCSRMEQIRLIPVANTSRVRPDFLRAEGPISFGITNPSCTDCRGCDTKLISCSVKSTRPSASNANDTCRSESHLQQLRNNRGIYTGAAYGGFLSVEFARDVELQTTQYVTTQENLVHQLLGQEFNTVTLMNEFGKPVCVVNSGQHDIAIPNVTLNAFLDNIVWYMDLLGTQCDYIIFISNNCPLTDKYLQTKELVYEWNMGIRKSILHPTNANGETEDQWRDKIFFLDIFNASITYEHLDNIHMANSWYVALATFLSSIMNTNFGIYQ